ncbi:MAG: hypothetical protein FWH11_09455 [Micrococcales bacterium]|nr:hypothetical protein [Micrococcales bacterium]
MQNKTSLWAAGAAVAVIAILAAAYFLLVGPVMDSTAQTDEQRTQVEAQNQVLRSQNATLREQFERIDELREQLAVLHVQVPDAAEWDTFATLVGGLADDNGAVVTNIAGQPAVAIAGTVVVSEAGEEVPAGAGATGQAIPVTIAFQGSPAAVIGMISSLQGVDQRLFLVQTVEIQGLKANESAQPPVAEGDAGVVVNGYVLVQPPVAAVPDQVELPPWDGYAPSFSAG